MPRVRDAYFSDVICLLRRTAARCPCVHKSRHGCVCGGFCQQLGVCFSLLQDLHDSSSHSHYGPSIRICISLLLQGQQAFRRVHLLRDGVCIRNQQRRDGKTCPCQQRLPHQNLEADITRLPQLARPRRRPLLPVSLPAHPKRLQLKLL